MKTETKPTLVLSGTSGNAFAVLALASRAAKKAGWSAERIEAFMKEAKAGNYDHLLATAQKYFDVD